MPLYTYRCKSCGVQFDKRQGFDDPPLRKCPECSKLTLRKVYLPVGILFKGPGFYATDHRSASGSNGQAAKTDSSSGDTASTTQKPAKETVSDKKAGSDD